MTGHMFRLLYEMISREREKKNIIDTPSALQWRFGFIAETVTVQDQRRLESPNDV